MHRNSTIALGLTAFVAIAPFAAIAQNAPPTYQADPSVYKIIFEDQNLRVIAATWKAGVADKPHSHPVPSIVYSVNDCKLKLTSADGKSVDRDNKAGTSTAVPITPSHTAQNVGTADCQAIFVERK